MPNHLVPFFAALLGSLYLLAVTIPLSLADIRSLRLPNRLVLPAIPITVLGQVTAVIIGAPGWRSLLALGCAFGVFVLGVFVSIRGLWGMGDAKLLAAITLALSWFSLDALWLALLVSFAGASGVVLVRAALQRWVLVGLPAVLSLKTKIPLGPYLMAGHLAALVQILTTAVVWSSTAR